jgi:hypothetical protein
MSQRSGSKGAAPWPIQVSATVPYAPGAFPSEGAQHLFYEVHLTNFSGSPIPLRRLDVIDGDAPAAAPVVSFSAEALAALTRTVGQEDRAAMMPIPAGGTQIVFVEVKIPEGQAVPRRLVHRISIGDGTIVMAAIPVRRAVKVLGRPVTGSDWIAADGPGSDPDNHHRRGLFISNGSLTDSRRLAIDWRWSGTANPIAATRTPPPPTLPMVDRCLRWAMPGWCAPRTAIPTTLPGTAPTSTLPSRSGSTMWVAI